MGVYEKNFARLPVKRNKIIPIECFIEPSEMVNPKLSPTGRYILYGKSGKGLYIRSTETDEEICVLAQASDAFAIIDHYFWSYDEKTLFFTAHNVDEQSHLFSVNRETKKLIDYTPRADRVKVLNYSGSKIIIAMSQENTRFTHAYECDINTGELHVLEKNDSTIVQWYADENEICLALRVENDGAYTLLKKEHEKWVPIRLIPYENVRQFQVLEISKQHQYILILDPGTHDTTQIISIDLLSGKEQSLFSHSRYDIYSYNNHSIVIKGNKNYTYWHSSYRKDVLFLKRALKAASADDISFVNNDYSNTWWIVQHESNTIPHELWLYNRTTRIVKKISESLPALKNYTRPHSRFVRFKARDGLPLSGFISYPVKIRIKYPLVVYVHGGPWEQEEPGFHLLSQFLTNRGYAVLRINFRGSAGFGKQFINKADHEWGKAMHTDIVDGVRWAIRHGAIDPKHIIICGESYGAYEVLMALALNSELFIAGIAINGPVNLVTWLETLPDYWSMHRCEMYKRIGNPMIERDFLLQRSPIFYSESITSPLLMINGKRDVRIKWGDEHLTLLNTLTNNKIYHECVIFDDEGHEILKPQNRKNLFARIEAFLNDPFLKK